MNSELWLNLPTITNLLSLPVAWFAIPLFFCWYVARQCSAKYPTFRVGCPKSPWLSTQQRVHNDYEANKTDKKVLCYRYSLSETKVMEWKGNFHLDDNAMYTDLKVEQTYGLETKVKLTLNGKIDLIRIFR
uniref:Uncharacterized protein n=1 Tax=Glossina austeni TaxID=7395 RepID=A0A1A9V6S2_GLOAU